MSYGNNKLINDALNRSYALIDHNIRNDAQKVYEFRKQALLDDESLTDNEKTEAIRIITKTYDLNKLTFNKGTKRICENCNQECLATTYCEHCIRNHLKSNFLNWSSGNDNVDKLIQECQMNILIPNAIPEWIPYNNLKNIKYLTKGGCSKIYTANWIDGSYEEWDSNDQQLKRFGTHNVVLKKLKNVGNANQNWLEEAKSYLNISNKWTNIVQCFGLTRNPSNGNYMLVMNMMDIDLRRYLQQNHNQLTWKERIEIITDIIRALERIHYENVIHRNLHSGNVLFTTGEKFYISDLGFCGPADKPLKSIYGNLPYIAPEVIVGKEQTFKSDIYFIAMLMWEISSGQPPFVGYKHDYHLAMNIVNGIRPKILSGTPLEYKNLMKQCWDADPSKRPDIKTLMNRIDKLNLFYQTKSSESSRLEENNNLEIETYSGNSKLFTSKLHRFDNLPEPRNATEDEQKAFHNDFHIPHNSSKKNISKIFKVSGKKLSKIFKRSSKNDIQNNYKIEQMQQQKMNLYIKDNDEGEIYNNPKLRSFRRIR